MRDREPETIEHNRYELPNDTTPWRLMAAVVAFGWLLAWYTDNLHGASAMLGVGTGGLLASWAIVRTGGKVPASWRKPPGRR